jgi:hypothetical protein
MLPGFIRLLRDPRGRPGKRRRFHRRRLLGQGSGDPPSGLIFFILAEPQIVRRLLGIARSKKIVDKGV